MSLMRCSQKIWASKSLAHRWLKRWESDDTLLKNLQARIIRIAEEKRLIDWSYSAVDGSFLLRSIQIAKPHKGFVRIFAFC